jgi:hypothetical protein
MNYHIDTISDSVGWYEVKDDVRLYVALRISPDLEVRTSLEQN